LGVTLEEKQALSRQLLACGAAIQEINCVRKHLSRIKGGRLALASAAPVATLAISDVPGDDPSLIASGPTVPDPTTPADARAVLARHGIEPSAGVNQALQHPGTHSHARLADVTGNRFKIVASGLTALQAAAGWCRDHGIDPLVLGDQLQGEARTLALEHAAIALARSDEGKRVCLLSGGETTVALGLSPGRGGRNTEYALALAAALDGHRRIWALAADTDGIDGKGGHSGAIIGPQTLARAAAAGLDPGDFLRGNDSATFFERTGGLLAGGPTGTNVNDFRAILINP
jgi:hydroxypyruvate reductase